MGWISDLKEKGRGHIILGLFGLITLLLLVIWRAVPSSTWDTVSEAVPKRVLWALIALELIAIGLQSAFALDNRRKRKLAPPKLIPMFGLLWDEHQNPYCPADQTPLSHYSWMPADYDILQCMRCGGKVAINHERRGNITLFEAKKIVPLR